jgi:hypothetical protein
LNDFLYVPLLLVFVDTALYVPCGLNIFGFDEVALPIFPIFTYVSSTWITVGSSYKPRGRSSAAAVAEGHYYYYYYYYWLALLLPQHLLHHLRPLLRLGHHG